MAPFGLMGTARNRYCVLIVPATFAVVLCPDLCFKAEVAGLIGSRDLQSMGTRGWLDLRTANQARLLPSRPLPESGPTRQLIGTFKRSPKTSEMGGNSPLIFDNESRLRSLVCRRSKGRRIASARIGPSKEKTLDSGAPVTPVLTRRRHQIN
jgi:hypothetical protein